MSQDPQLFQQGMSASTSSPAQVFSDTRTGATEPASLPGSQMASLKPDAITSARPFQRKQGDKDDLLTLEEYIASMQEFSEIHQDWVQPCINESVKMKRDSWTKSIHSLESNSNTFDAVFP